MPTLELPNIVVYSLLGVKMTDEDFYKYSKLLRAYVEFAKKVAGTHHFRHSIIVDSSDRGLDCPYAKKTLEFANKFEPGFIELLKANADLVPEVLISTLEEIQNNNDRQQDKDSL